MSIDVKNSELGKKTEYISTYNPDVLFPVPRQAKRDEIGVDSNNLPFKGYDCWNHYEVSWLNSKGKPIVALAEIFYDCTSEYIIESKSLKLYFNSFNNTKYNSKQQLKEIIEQDLSKCINIDVTVNIYDIDQHSYLDIQASLDGENIDNLDIECTEYMVKPDYLLIEEASESGNSIEVSETLNSNLLKSNCLVTNQPDWGSVQITYKGNKINREGLLKYLISFRNHNEFHEQCIERIFVDIMKFCKPRELTVYGRYTRRGGLDINPFRTNLQNYKNNINTRLSRQ